MIETKEFKSFYKQVGGNEGEKCHYTTRLDVYGCGCQHDCNYCLDEDTLILMYDGTTKHIKDIEIGDDIYGVEFDGKYHRYVKSIVLNKWFVEKPSYKITLENGEELVCSEDHRWLSNRGWKYTTGEMSGTNQRPYLTTNNSLMGFSTIIDTDSFKETDMYKSGYLSGVIRGDGNLTIHDYSGKRENRGIEIQYHFRLGMKDEQAVKRTEEYLSYFGIDTNEFIFPMKDRHTKIEEDTLAIRTHRKDNWYAINDLIEYNDDKEYLRGFLAGIYDAEGYGADNNIKRIFNCDQEIIDMIEKGMQTFDIKYTFDKDKKTPSGKILKTIRIVGGHSEFLKFYQITQPAVSRKFDFTNSALKNSTIKVVSIEPYKDSQVLYDITTSTENFIANGVVSHNCYAKSLLDFRNLWNPTNPSVADIEKVKRKIAKLPKDIPAIRIGGMSDMFAPIEKKHHVAYETIKCLNEHRIPYLIVTKGAMIADDEYIEILDKDLAHIQVTITSTDDKVAFRYEKASRVSDRIKAIEKLQEYGFDIALRLSPYIKENVDLDILNNVKCDKILIEFLRVNSWIKKWFDVDYSDYTVKQSGYWHLPLKKKIELLEGITGFKEMTICEDESEAYEYWQKNFNHNPDDCCNLRI